MNEASKRRNEYLPYILIAAGILVLLANIGWFSFGGLINALVSVAQLWPVALIAIGADMLTQGKHRAIVVAVALIVGAALFVTNGVTDLFGRGGSSGTESVSMPLAGAQSSRIDLSSGVGRVAISVAPGSSEGVAGTVQPAAGERLTQSSQVRNGVFEAEIVSRTVNVGPFGFSGRGGAWELRLSDRVPVRLDFDGGVGESNLDLRGLDLTGLDIDAGVGAVEVTLPASGSYEASIDAGVGEVVVRVPADASVRFTVSTGLGGVSTSGGFERSGNNVYFSPGFASGRPTANVVINGGVGAVTLTTVR